MSKNIHLVGLVLHFNQSAPALTEKETKLLIKGLLDALRQGAKYHGWEYRVWVAYSTERLREVKKADRHIHIMIYFKGFQRGKEGLVEAVANYWCPKTPKARNKTDKPTPKRRRWGKVVRHGIYDAKGFIGYMQSQTGFKMRVQESKGANEFLPLEAMKDYEMSKEEYMENLKMSEKIQTKNSQ